MKSNRPSKRRSDRFRVITFDDLEHKTPSLTDYFSSFKSWFKPGSSSNPKKEATTSRAVQKSRSCSAVSTESVSNTRSRKYTRSRTLSLEDLKRLFLINNVFSLERLQSSQIFSKKRSARTKVKKGEEYLNKWDRDIKVLYNCESNKFSGIGPKHPPDTSPSDSSFPASSSSTVRSSGKLGLLMDTRNYGRNGKEPCFCDYRSTFCTSKKVCPCYVQRSPCEECENKTLQNRGRCYCCPRKNETGNICTCCFPIRKLDNTKTDYANIHTSTNKHVYGYPNQKVDHGSTKTPTSSSPKRKDADPKIDNTNKQTFIKQKEADPKSDLVNTQTSNNICTKCFCSHEKQNDTKTGPKIDSAKTQTSNYVSAQCCYPKHKAAGLKSDVNSHAPNNISAKSAPQPGPWTDYAKTQTPNDVSAQFCCPKHKPVGKKNDHDQTQNTSTCTKCFCSHRKQPHPKTGPNTDYARTQTTKDACAQCCCRKHKPTDPKADYNNTQTTNNKHTCNCSKKIHADSKADLANTQKSEKYACGCRKKTLASPKTGLAETQTTKKYTCGCPKKTQASPRTDIANTQTSKKYTCGCSKKMQAAPKTDYAKTQTTNDTCTQCYSPKTNSVDPRTDYPNIQASNNKYSCGCSKQWETDLKTDYAKTQTANDICTQCYIPDHKPSAPVTDYSDFRTSKSKCSSRCPKQRKASPNRMIVSPKSDSTNTQTSNNILPDSYPRRNEANLKDSFTSAQTLINLFTCGCSRETEANVETSYAYTQTSKTLSTCRCPKPKETGSETDYAKLNMPKNTCTYRSQAKKKYKSKCCKAYHPADLTQDHNRLRTYFGKLRRRNLEIQRNQTGLRRRFDDSHIKKGRNFPMKNPLPNEAPCVVQPMSHDRREAVLSAIKVCPDCVTPIFPDSSPSSTDIPYQPPCMRTQAYLKNTEAQTSKVKPAETCSCLQKIIKKQEGMPDCKRKYILYHNNIRGWLAKPLRMRQSSRLGVKVGIKRRRGISYQSDRSLFVRKEIHNSPTGNHSCDCTRIVHDGDCYKCLHECTCSSSSPDNSSQKCSCRNVCTNFHNSDCSADHKLIYSLYEDSPGNNVNNLGRNVRECNCPVCCKRKKKCLCRSDHKYNNYRNGINIISQNSPCQPCMCFRDTDGNCVDPYYPYSRQRCLNNKPCFIRRSIHRFCTCCKKTGCTAVDPCIGDDPYSPYLKPRRLKHNRCGTKNIRKFCNCFRKTACDVTDLCNGDDPCYRYSQGRCMKNNRYGRERNMRGYGDYCRKSDCNGVDSYRPYAQSRSMNINKCGVKRNMRSFRETNCNDIDPCNVADPHYYPRRRRRKTYRYSMRRNIRRLCNCFRGTDCDDADPYCPYSQPHCTKENPCCQFCNCYRTRRYYRRYYNCPINYDWMCYSAPESCCRECCRGCGRCCRGFWLTVTAILWCPIILVWIICHNIFCGCW